MKFNDDNFPKRDYDTDIRLMVQDKLGDLVNQVVTNICPSCGKELQFNYVDIYDHPYGWHVIPEIPKQWISVRCHKCKYNVSINKLGVSRC